MSSAASPSRIADLKATLRIAQLDSDDDTNPTWDDFEQALATVDALAARALSLEPRSCFTGSCESELGAMSDSAASTDECGCGGPLVACEKCGDSRCLSCDPYDASDTCERSAAARIVHKNSTDLHICGDSDCVASQDREYDGRRDECEGLDARADRERDEVRGLPDVPSATGAIFRGAAGRGRTGDRGDARHPVPERALPASVASPAYPYDDALLDERRMEEHARSRVSSAAITEPLSQAELRDAICDILDICEGWTRTMTDKQCLAAIKDVASKAFEGDRG